ncbi:TadA family conjugal transfer-associated ATPase [Corynebacterium pelargi]|uniref:Conjugal transfer protein n=1 Tax=Corynebacterium pelargi TaxID=1471400 RepID=A0A410WBF9_9CORY|nr:TadA family conjugal transfer-associated ATPase [Corynebacterium pelargi]QAU53291.1 Putative conjugal transfer protein [Corynebacterium pelargi]GGG73507.1 ATPase involved in pili and flagella biosynthesis [Corynebacterium pelargi]
MSKYDTIIQEVQRRLAEAPTEDDTALASLVREVSGGVISNVDVVNVLRALRHESTGVGPLEQVLAIHGVTDVLVHGCHGVWFDRGRGLEKSQVRFSDDAEVRRLATRLLVAAGRRLDDAQCFADGRIPRADGSALRVHAVLSPPAETGTCLSLRVLRQAATSLEALEAGGTFQPGVAECLRQLIAVRKSMLIIGGTGSGKTTLLGALLAQVDPRERIIGIEDTAELRPDHPHFVSLVSKTHNTEGKGEVRMEQLLRQALRMRPDRIVLGEIRGAEVVDLLAALNTGHDGCAGTVHANTVEEVPARLEALGALGGLDQHALHSQLSAAAPVVLAMKRTAHGRSLHQIGILRGNPVEVAVLWDARQGVSCQVDWSAL